jgi:hypothetical protein
LSHLKQSLLQYAPGLQALTVAGSASVALELELRGNNSAVKNGKLSLKGFSLSAPNSPRISDGDGEFSVRGPLADANIETSSLHVSLNGEPLTISTRLRAQPSQVVVESLSLHGFRGSAELPAVITTSPKPLTIKGAQSASNLSLQALLKAIRPGASPAITGTLASLRSDLSSLIVERPDQVDAHIDVVIRDGSIVGLNLLNQLMAKLSELPFISESLQRRIPKQFEGLFSRPDTPIRELTFSGKIERGQANLSRISLLSDIFDLKGSGTYSLRGDVSMACELTFSTELSTALLEKAPELKALTDNSDRLVIPLTLKGSAPAVLVLPDLASIAKKTSAGALQKLLQDGLKGGKGLGKDLKKIFGF